MKMTMMGLCKKKSVVKKEFRIFFSSLQLQFVFSFIHLFCKFPPPKKQKTTTKTTTTMGIIIE